MKSKIAAVVASAALMLMSLPAFAITNFHYVLTGGYNAEWFIDATALTDLATLNDGIGYYDVQGTFPGHVPSYLADVRFWNSTFGTGGFTLVDHYSGDVVTLNLTGAQLYTGLETSPTLSTGLFAFSDGLTTYELSVDLCNCDPVPEPSTWAMMLAGFGGIGAALRSRRRRIVLAA